MEPIDRQDAIDIVTFECGEWIGLAKEINEQIQRLPSAQPVRHGKWIRDEFGTRCGSCGLYAYRDKFDQPWESPYCPNCGAKMDGENG